MKYQVDVRKSQIISFFFKKVTYIYQVTFDRPKQPSSNSVFKLLKILNITKIFHLVKKIGFVSCFY